MASERGSEGDIKSFAGKRTLLALGELALDVVGQLLVLSVRCRGVLLALLSHGLGVLRVDVSAMDCRLRCEWTYVRLVPLTEGGGIDLDDRALDKGVCTDKLVVRCVVNLQISQQIKIRRGYRLCTYDTDQTSLARNMLRAPGKVARVQTEGTELLVATAGAHSADALRTELGVRSLATELELSLFAEGDRGGSGGRALVP